MACYWWSSPTPAPAWPIAVRLTNGQTKGSSHFKKTEKKGEFAPFGRPPPPPKRVKRGHLLSDYRQKCVNGTHIVVSKVHFWVIWDSYWLILWCQKSISEWFETRIDSYCGVKSPFLSDLRLTLWCQKSISEWFENPVNLGLKKKLGLTPLPPKRTMSPFFTIFFRRASLNRDSTLFLSLRNPQIVEYFNRRRTTVSQLWLTKPKHMFCLWSDRASFHVKRLMNE